MKTDDAGELDTLERIAALLRSSLVLYSTSSGRLRVTRLSNLRWWGARRTFGAGEYRRSPVRGTGNRAS